MIKKLYYRWEGVGGGEAVEFMELEQKRESYTNQTTTSGNSTALLFYSILSQVNGCSKCYEISVGTDHRLSVHGRLPALRLCKTQTHPSTKFHALWMQPVSLAAFASI